MPISPKYVAAGYPLCKTFVNPYNAHMMSFDYQARLSNPEDKGYQ